MRVTKWGEYGILCSLYLARRHQQGPVTAVEIAEAQQIPLQYTHQILQRLRKGGIVESERGPRGGYAIARTPEQTTLREILYAAEGDTFQVICETQPVYGEQCGDSPCGLKSVWMDLKRSVDALLESRTLAWIMEQERIAGEQLVRGPQAATRGVTPEALPRPD